MFEPRCHRVEDADSGLLAFVVIDDRSLGPAAGGIRTRAYEDEAAARADAAALARAMTYKCALAGLPAGGGKGVVMLRPGLDRDRAFERLGAFVDSLGGDFLTAGDLGTTADDLRALARRTRHVVTDEAGLAEAVGRGCTRAMQACLSLLGDSSSNGQHPTCYSDRRHGGSDDLGGARVAVQGCGTVGAAVARQARALGAAVVVADIDEEVARRTADELDADVLPADRILEADVDVLAPCADGGVIDPDVAARLRAAVVCGAANNILASPAPEAVLMRRGVLWVPDPISSAGAVILGVCRANDALVYEELVDRIFHTTRRVVGDARDRGIPAGQVARQLAERRILHARR